MRRGVTLVEIIVGITILALGMIPVLNLLGGTRGRLGQSQEMLLAESASFQALASERSRIAAGEFVDMEDNKEEEHEYQAPGVRSLVVLVREPDRPLFRLKVSSETKQHFFEITCWVADPFAAIGLPVTELEPLPEDGL
jgi:prepilin-type N-terminal cleavage/methylation domain-containing protein